MYIQNFSVCTGTTPACVTTCGRGAGTHGEALNVHTGVEGGRFERTHGEGEGRGGRRGGAGEGWGGEEGSA